MKQERKPRIFISQTQKLVRSRTVSRQAPDIILGRGNSITFPHPKLITSLLLKTPQKPLLTTVKCILQFCFFISAEYGERDNKKSYHAVFVCNAIVSLLVPKSQSTETTPATPKAYSTLKASRGRHRPRWESILKFSSQK